jgi:hypothetical protein
MQNVVFPAVIDREEVKKRYLPLNDNPKLTIHCIQETFKKRECN